MITASLSPSKQWHCRYYSFSINAISGEHEYCIKKGTFNFECSKQCPYVEIIEVIPKMTNYEKIKNMTIDDMAKFLCQGDRPCDGCRGEKEPLFCLEERQRITEWLEKEAST